MAPGPQALTEPSPYPGPHMEELESSKGEKMGHIHAANPAKSRRLGAVLEFLKKRGDEGATTREIIKTCEVCAVNSIIAELRVAGHEISCKTTLDTATGGRVARYKLQTAAVSA